jgi:hypothetical protein
MAHHAHRHAEKEMLSEARARLANTQGKKAKRKVCLLNPPVHHDVRSLMPLFVVPPSHN